MFLQSNAKLVKSMVEQREEIEGFDKYKVFGLLNQKQIYGEKYSNTQTNSVQPPAYGSSL